MTRSRLVFKNGIFLTITAVLTGVLGMFYSGYVARKIGAEAMGVLTLTMSVYNFAMTLAISGINLASTRLVAEEMAFSNEKGARRSIAICIVYSLIFSIVSSFLLIVFSGFVGTKFLHNQITIRPLIILAISLPFVAISSVLGGYFNAMQEGIKSASTVIFEQFSRISACSLLIGMFFAHRGVSEMVMAIVLAELLTAVVSCIYRIILYVVRKRAKTGNVENVRLIRKMLKIAMPMAFSSYLKSALTTTKQILVPLNLELSGMVYSVALAQYGVIQGMILPLLLFPACFLYAFSTLLVPEISKLNVQARGKRIRQVISRIFKCTMVFSVFIGGIFFAFAEQISTLIFNKPEIAGMLRIFAFCVPITYFDVIVDSLLKGLDRQVAVVNINIADSLFTILLIVFLIPRFGLLGYIIVFFASETFNAILSIGKLLQTTACRFDVVNWLLKPIVAVGCAMFCRGNVLVFIAVFFVVLFATRAVERGDFVI